ncbi:cyclase family protein [Chloroflexota bacterium]
MANNTDDDAKLPSASKSGWIDITIPLRNAMLYWPKDPFIPEVKTIWDVNKGDKVTLSEFHFHSHTGTHIDAPLHFVPGGGTIDEMPLDIAVGPARVIEIKDPESVKVEELAPYDIQRGERLLFKTQNSSKLYKTDQFSYEYVYLTIEAAEYLFEKGIVLIGWDYITLGKYQEESDWPTTIEYLANSEIHHIHRLFLGHGIYIMECLNLEGVKPGNYELVCVPIKLEGGDAGMTRAIIRPV